MDKDKLSKMYDFAGHCVVVTGGTGVLGSAMVRALAGCDADIALLARDREKADQLVASVGGAGRKLVVEADVLAPEDVRRAARTIKLAATANSPSPARG